MSDRFNDLLAANARARESEERERVVAMTRAAARNAAEMFVLEFCRHPVADSRPTDPTYAVELSEALIAATVNLFRSSAPQVDVEIIVDRAFNARIAELLRRSPTIGGLG